MLVATFQNFLCLVMTMASMVMVAVIYVGIKYYQFQCLVDETLNSSETVDRYRSLLSSKKDYKKYLIRRWAEEDTCMRYQLARHLEGRMYWNQRDEAKAWKEMVLSPECVVRAVVCKRRNPPSIDAWITIDTGTGPHEIPEVPFELIQKAFDLHLIRLGLHISSERQQACNI